MKKAIFSNGTTDTYKGKRAVTAAWAIISRDTGETLMSGHSLDRAKAQKTAESNLIHVVASDSPAVELPKRGYPSYNDKYVRQRLIAAGYDPRLLVGDSGLTSVARQHAAKCKAERIAKVKIEVVVAQ